MQWTYERVERVRLRPVVRGEFTPWSSSTFDIVETVTRTRVMDGRTYFEVVGVGRDRLGLRSSYNYHSWMRQASDGLYELRLAGGVAGLGIASPAPSERLVLPYPAHPGTHFTGNAGSVDRFVIEAIDPIRTGIGVEPAARVVRLDFAAGHESTKWFGRVGRVAWATRSESIFPGEPRMMLERDSHEILVTIDSP
jgi:hypothetical protein